MSIPFLYAAATIVPGRALQIVLLVGVALLTIAIGILTWTRWGQGRPITKCAILSLFAHVLLFCFCWGTRIFFDTPGRILGDGEFHVRIVDSADEEMAPESDSTSDALPAENVAAAPPAEKPKLENNPEPMPEQVAAKPVEKPADPPPPREQPEPAAEETVPTPPPVEAVAQKTQSPKLPTQADMPDAFEPASADTLSVPVVTQPIVPRRLGDGQEMPQLLRSRVGNRLLLAERFGGNATTEGAVEAALDWLAANQSASGRWDADLHGAGRENHYLGHNRLGAGKRADTGISGLALLAFLGAGQSHLEGKHREHVQHGLEFLLASQASDGNLFGDAELFARMYCHGIATLALCEAYALTGDER
ncbi:MAG: hypothetical protein WEH44_07995, partial [Pirellulaceae bacterium]